jgi:hypothetical protein
MKSAKRFHGTFPALAVLDEGMESFRLRTPPRIGGDDALYVVVE